MKDRNKKLLKLAALTAATAGAIYGINRLAFWASTLKDVLFSKEKSFYHWRFGNMYYTKQGSGKPLLLIHELTAWGSDYEWQSLIEKLTENHTVYTIDLPGCGRSDKEKMTYTNYLYVQAVNEFVKHVIKARTDVITSGDSSSIAVMACHSEPALYDRLIFINPESLAHMSAIQKPIHKCLCRFMQLPLVGTLAYVIINARPVVKCRATMEYFYDSQQMNPNVVDAFSESAHLGGFSTRFAYASQLGYYTRINVVHALKKLDHSMYIIGGSDMKGIEKTIDGYTYFNPAIECMRVAGTKRMPHMESTDSVAMLCKLYLGDEA